MRLSTPVTLLLGLFLVLALSLTSPATLAEGEVSASEAAKLLREVYEKTEPLTLQATQEYEPKPIPDFSETFKLWERTVVHRYKDPAIHGKYVVRAMLNHLTGQGALPVADASLVLVPCPEAPLPTTDQVLYRGVQYNLHGAVLSDAPLTNVTVKISHKGETSSLYPMVGSVDFSEAADVHYYGLDDSRYGATAVNNLVDFRQLKLGRHKLEIFASNTAQKDKLLFSVDFSMDNANNSYPLLQANFGDNYFSALRFFQYEPERFQFNYSLREGAGERMMSTATVWREANIVDSNTVFGNVHKDALPYFMQAYEYLETSYFRVHSDSRDSRVRQLKTLIGEECGAYVPRFQNNERYISHHSLGTCVDINYDLFPNTDFIENHALIGDDVRDHLIYNGIEVDENGQQYYDFTYTGNYPRVNKIPKTIVNYLLYELAFYRAGFAWGYYYYTSCDAMHFTLTDTELARHTAKDIGLRKVYEYYN